MKGILIVLVVAMLLGAAYCGSEAQSHYLKGMDKYTRYYNTDWGSANAYVGGDAYNYIINAGYFSAFSTIAVGYGISAALLAVGAILLAAIIWNKSKEPDKKHAMTPAPSYAPEHEPGQISTPQAQDKGVNKPENTGAWL